MTSGALSQEAPLNVDGMEWMPRKNCFCVSTKNLAKAGYALEYAKTALTLKDEEFARRTEAFSSGAELKLKLTTDHCSAQIVMMKDSYNRQMRILMEQSDTLVTDLTDAYSERLLNVSGLIKPKPPTWYTHPAFWGTIGVVGGAALGAGIGAIIWR